MPEMMFPLEITRKKRMKKASRRVVSIDNTRRDAVNPQNSRAPDSGRGSWDKRQQ